MPSHHFQNRAASTGTDRTGPLPRAMITSQGYGLIAESIAAALLIVALSGLLVQRSKPVAGRGHDGIRDTHSGRDGGHRFIDLGARSKINYAPG